MRVARSIRETHRLFWRVDAILCSLLADQTLKIQRCSQEFSGGGGRVCSRCTVCFHGPADDR